MPKQDGFLTQLKQYLSGLYQKTFGSRADPEADDVDDDAYSDDTLDSLDQQETNEQPTKIKTSVLIAALGLVVVLSLMFIYLLPDDNAVSEQKRQQQEQKARTEQAKKGQDRIPGLRGQDGGEFNPERWSEGSSFGSGSGGEDGSAEEALSVEEQNRRAQRRRDSLLGRPPEGERVGSRGQADIPPPSERETAAEAFRRARERGKENYQRRDNPYSRTGRSGQSGRSSLSKEERQKRAQSREKAKASKVSVSMEPPGQFDPRAAGSPRHPASGRPMGQPPTPSDMQKENQYAREQSSSKSSREQYEERAQARHPTGNLSQEEQFLEKQRSRGSMDVQPNTVRGPFGPFVLPKGTLIPITLETGSSNQLPGNAIMRVSRDVYDRSKRYILIPRGSEIVSSYSTSAQVGQSRLMIAANRLNLPDGRYVQFRDARAASLDGFAGLEDQKDRHLASRFAAAGGLAILGAAVAITDPFAGLSTSSRDSTNGREVVTPGLPLGARAAAGFSQQVNDVISQILEKQIDRDPTLRLRPGKRGILLLNEDLDMKSPYYEEGDDFDQMNREMERYRQDRFIQDQERRLQRVKRYYDYQDSRKSYRDRLRKARESGADRGYGPVPPSPGSRNLSPPSQAQQPQYVQFPPKYYYQESRYAPGGQLPTYMPPRTGYSPRERYIRREYMGGEGLDPNAAPQRNASDPRFTRDDGAAYSSNPAGPPPERSGQRVDSPRR